ncbi:MAG: AraC family transcriptional regulator [Pseudomonadota bacterium]
MDEVRRNLTEIFTSHELKMLDKSTCLSTRVDEVCFGDSSIVHIAYGAPVIIEADRLENCYLFQAVLGGDLEVCSERTSQAVNFRHVSILSPDELFKLQWGAETDVLTVRLSKSAIDRNLQSIVGAPIHRTLQFDPLLDLSSAEGKQWVNVQEFTQRQLALSPYKAPKIGGVVEDTLAHFALHLLPHNYTHIMQEQSLKRTPRILQRAKEFVAANYTQSIDVAAIASYAGASQATLCKHFRKQLNMSPGEYLRKVRLDSARKDLLAAHPHATVAEIATKNGFNHLSRFSAYYQSQFGETPSTTLRLPS